MQHPIVLRPTRLITVVIVALFIVPLLLLNVEQNVAHASTLSPHTRKNQHPQFCNALGKTIQASSGAQMYCFGPQRNGAGTPKIDLKKFGSNVDAANPNEDITPAGVRGYGQSETSIASMGKYVVEAWNDSTSFFSVCAPMSKDQGTGYGFSADGGASFVDEGGLPNANCNTSLYEGDPSVEVWSPGGTPYFYISSLFFNSNDPRSFLALAACKVAGTGSSATLSCSQPVVIASSTICHPLQQGVFCTFLDKDYISIDPQRGRLYVSYTEFDFDPTTFIQTTTVELAACDIGTSSGGTGSLGGTAGTPVCNPGANGTVAQPAPAYFVVAPASVCENEGAYPAVDLATGDVYVAYEHNWATNFFDFNCINQPTQNVVSYIPFSCLPLAATSTCSGPAATNGVSIISMDTASIPGYNRFQMNDFPRIAVSSQAGTVSIVWNDAGKHFLGDILLQSFALKTLSAVQQAPVRLNNDTSGGVHMMPALRNADANGKLNVSWYDRRNAPSTTQTDVFAAIGVNPLTSRTPASNLKVTNVPSDWSTNVSDIVPNFGDYTDNYVAGSKLYVAWSDGRLHVPQPFEANLGL
jgi:hypothetical protein